MREELLKEIREDYLNQKQQQKEVIDLQDQIKELEKNPIVAEYLNLTQKLESVDLDLAAKTDDQIIDSAFRRHIRSSEDTNCIYFCIGTFMKSSECDIEHGPSDTILNRNDPRAEYRIYIDIEKYDSKQIPISECEMFERTHKVIIPRSSLAGESKYYKVQREFITTAVSESQKAACSLVLNKKY